MCRMTCVQARRVLRAANTAGQYNHLIGFADPLGDVRLEVYNVCSVRQVESRPSHVKVMRMKMMCMGPDQCAHMRLREVAAMEVGLPHNHNVAMKLHCGIRYTAALSALKEWQNYLHHGRHTLEQRQSEWEKHPTKALLSYCVPLICLGQSKPAETSHKSSPLLLCTLSLNLLAGVIGTEGILYLYNFPLIDSSGGGGQDGGEHHLIAPPEYGPEVAEKAVQALRGLSKNWLSLMCKVSVDAAHDTLDTLT
eukprot:scaffold249487_cov21-Tisochrysis_lutea.AAC.1